MKHFIILLSCLIIISCNPVKQKSAYFSEILPGHWQFYIENSETWYPAIVPGVIHLDLLANQLIEDPFWGKNELKQRWIEDEDWVYKTTFIIDELLKNYQNIELNFEGLDTYADVYLNGQKILSANNMFRSWNIEVSDQLAEGENELKVVFHSPVKYNEQKVENYPYPLPSGNETTDIKTKVSSFTRKAAYQFGWDFAPRFVTCGIWRPISINAWNKAKIADVFTSTQEIDIIKAKMLTQIEIEVAVAGDYVLIVDGNKHTEKLSSGRNILYYPFEIENPKLWWCNGYGEAHLYSQNVEFISEKETIDHKTINYGVRTIELVNEPDSIGTSFYFLLNGKPIFIKGANYIPQDMFLPRVTDEQYKKLIEDVKEANMNMLRVWGGGIYENELFYDLCDQNGILVWQDFMFAGSLYPDDIEFKENVKQEVIQNIKRLRGHPSIALWCGNNEIEVAWNNWGWQKQYGYSPEESTMIWNNYLAIFHQLIPELIAIYDPLRVYTPTTPLSNWGSAENFNHGSMHYWGVWHGREPFENFENNVGRFMVEYGFQSFPEISTLQQVMSDSSLNLNSSAMKNRQKSYIGNGLISDHINQYYGEPETFTAFVLLSQQTQAKGLGMAIKAHKNKQPHCMGTLFWQLNDCWPGPSWSVIDYYGKHKLAYDVVKKEFANEPQL
jgi:beta-mannosidase